MPITNVDQSPGHASYPDQNFDQASTVLGEVAGELSGASPQVFEAHKVVPDALANLRRELSSAESTVDRSLADTDIYPEGRIDRAQEAINKAREMAATELGRADLAARSVEALIKAAAIPAFVGDASEQAFVRQEISAIVDRSPDALEALSSLANNPRYAALAAGDFGASLLMGRDLNGLAVEDAIQLVRSEAVSFVASNGTPEQKQAVVRLGAAEKLRLAHLAAAQGAAMKLEDLQERVGWRRR